MKKTLLGASLALALASMASAANYEWTNTLSNNDFGNFGNWLPVPVTFRTNTFLINHSGADRAEISTNLVDVHPSVPYSGRIRVGTQAARRGELLISGGTNVFGEGLQLGVVVGGAGARTGICTITGGSVAFPSNFTTIGESTNTVATFIMSGGAFQSDRMTAATALGAAGTIIVTGGYLSIYLSDDAPASTSGALRMGSGAAEIHIGGTAEVTVQFLGFGQTNAGPIGPGFMTMSNGVLNITGSMLTNAPPITFCPGRTVAFEGGVWNVVGDVKSDIQQAVADGIIYHSAGNDWIRASYDSTNDTTAVKIQQPTALESWRFQYFGTIEGVGDAADAADPENDTIENIIEFGFGLHPLQSSAGLLPQCMFSGGNLTLSFTEPGGIGGIAYGAESSTNLLDWSTVADGGSDTNHTFSVPIGSEPRMFMRLLVTEQ